MIARIAASHETRPHLAEELVQEILFAVWRALPSFRDDSSLRSFIARIASNRAASHVASAIRTPIAGELDEELPVAGDNQEGATLASDQQARLLREVRKLPLVTRQVVTLTLDGFGAGEIATALDSTFGAAVGVFTVRQGWRLGALNFGVRGLAVLIVAGILWGMVATLWNARRADDVRSLSQFAELGFARAQRNRRAVVLGLTGCAVAAILGVIGTVLRAASDHPAALSPFIDLAVLALVAIIVEALRRRFHGEEARFDYLRKELRDAS